MVDRVCKEGSKPSSYESRRRERHHAPSSARPPVRPSARRAAPTPSTLLAVRFISAPMFDTARSVYARTLEEIRTAGLYKEERIITTPQGATIRTADGREVLNFCANNYLGLSSHPAVIEAARRALETHGFGLSSVRFICGTQDLHKELEGAVARFFGTDDAILYSSCFDANGGLFETLLGEEDAIISDALNHASIIDGIRLCKA